MTEITVLEFIWSLQHLPMLLNGNKPKPASKSDVRRWLESSSVLLNGAKPKPNDAVQFPVESLVFFPKSQNRTTLF